MSAPAIRLMLADVDGTLVTQDKLLTDRAIEAVHRMNDAGILFAVTSGRPPKGMSMLLEPLALTTPIAAFNGGMIVDDQMQTIEQRTVPAEVVGPMIELITSFGLDVWVYQGAEWLLQHDKGPHVDREAWTVKFPPKVVTSYEGVTDRVSKITGVSDDRAKIDQATAAAQAKFGQRVSAAQSQPYYLDVTNPDANKGDVVKFLASKYKLSNEEIATIGDMPNDILMFAHSGTSIAMGNAAPEVQRAARFVTSSNEEEGFANAVDQFVLRSSGKPT
ncbi:MAG TPA: Cof-type HAD-IIB family hydrolase [Acidimicrobiales bacterium]